MSVSPLWSALLQRLETVTEDKEAAYLEVLQDNLCQLQPQGRLEPLYQSRYCQLSKPCSVHPILSCV
ncbi:hypothetical protein [Shewanella algae]|uniref:hypothetical protein n=1 Tax=Shewanella algae TaxID=38313 RepID=UPI00300577A8